MSEGVRRFPFALEGACGETIRADLRLAGVGAPRPAAVFCHGFKGFKDWGCWPYFCERLAARGFAALSFNFSHNGIGEEPDRFARLDLFQRDTWSKQVEDLRLVLDAVVERRVPESGAIDPSRLAVLGHSRGGAVALLVAADDARVRALALLAPIANLDRFPKEAVARAREHGFYPVLNARTGELLPVGREAFEDLERNRERFSIEAAARRFARPLLVVHGTADETVPLEEGREVARWAGPWFGRFVPIEGAGHTFGAVHPFAGTTPALEDAFERVAEFVARKIGG